MVERNQEQVGGAGSGQNSVVDPEANGQTSGMQKQSSMVNEEELLAEEEKLKQLEQEIEESK